MPTFSSQDTHIHYQTFGDASHPAIIFSNSLGTNYRMWQAQIDHFKMIFLSFVMTRAVTVSPRVHKALIRLNNWGKMSLICSII